MASKAEQVRAQHTRKRALGLDAIVDAALEVIDAEGTDAVSMRRVAAEFDTGPASLYAYVANKQELFERVLDRITAEGKIPDDVDTWQDMIRGWAHSGRVVYRSHQDAAKLSFAYVPRSQVVVEGAEKLLGAMIEGGVPPQVAAWALDIVSLYVGADAYEGWLMESRSTDGSGRQPTEVAHAELAEVQSQFEAVPADRDPSINRFSRQLMVGDSDARFAFGIDMLIAGFEAQIPPSRDD